MIIIAKLRVFVYRLSGLFLKSKVDRDLQAEIQSHLEMQIEDNIRQGMDAAEARYAALRKFGGVEQVKDSYRRRRSLPVIDSLAQDLRYGFRILTKNPSFTAIVTLTLALGIGANTAIFSPLNVLMFKALPVQNPDQLIVVNTVPAGDTGNVYSYPIFKQFHDRNQTCSAVFATAGTDALNITMNAADGAGEPEPVEGELVSGGFFAGLGVSPIIGRVFTTQDDRVPGGHPVAVISHGYWKRRFGGSPAAVGRTFTLNKTPFTIIGVTPPGFFGIMVGKAPDLWIPMMMESQFYPGRAFLNLPAASWLQIMGRLKPESSLQQSQADFNVIFRKLLSDVNTADWTPRARDEFLAQGIELTPGNTGLSELRDEFSSPLRILMVVVGLVLFIACANVANLLLARAASRQKEIALRLTLGASRFRLVRQLLTESMLLAFAGGLLGLALAYLGGDVLLTLVSQGTAPIALNLLPDTRILAFTGAISLLTGILFGLAPAWRATRINLSPALKDGASLAGRGRAGSRLSRILVIVQVSSSLILLITAGLLIRSLQNLKSLDAGFNRENVLLLRTDSGATGYSDIQLKNLDRELIQRLSAMPGVRSASIAQFIFNDGGMRECCISIQGKPQLSEADRRMNTDRVGPQFFETMGIPLLLGRGFTPQDNLGSPSVAVINETAAQYYFPGESPIGQRLVWGKKEIEIVGLAKNVKHSGLREQAPRMFYFPIFQSETNADFLAVRTVGSPADMIAAVRRETKAVDPRLPIVGITTLNARVDASLARERLIGSLSSFFGLLALLLACVGLYGVMSYTVSRRTNEIGIRKALGAQHSDVLWMVLGETLRLVLAGAIIGLPAALAASRLIASLLFGLKPADPLTLSLMVVLLFAVATLAGYLPARKASMVDPMAALRYE